MKMTNCGFPIYLHPLCHMFSLTHLCPREDYWVDFYNFLYRHNQRSLNFHHFRTARHKWVNITLCDSDKHV